MDKAILYCIEAFSLYCPISSGRDMHQELFAYRMTFLMNTTCCRWDMWWKCQGDTRKLGNLDVIFNPELQIVTELEILSGITEMLDIALLAIPSVGEENDLLFSVLCTNFITYDYRLLNSVSTIISSSLWNVGPDEQTAFSLLGLISVMWPYMFIMTVESYGFQKWQF